MQHYTLNTGHSRHSPREEVGDDVIAKCRSWCADGWHDLPTPGWRLHSTPGERGSLLFSLHLGEEPIVTCGVAPDETAADEVWPVLERIHLDLTRYRSSVVGEATRAHQARDGQLAKRPDRAPWLAVVMVAMSATTVTAAFDLNGHSWIGDFERCIAWTWLTRPQPSQ